MKDAVIIGGGLAGLSAAWKLRQWDIEVLESDPDRIGGRIMSEKRGPYVMNWGGHMFAGGNSSSMELLAETGIHSARIPGSLQGMAMNGKFLTTGPVMTYPFRFPMSTAGRMSIMMPGSKLALDVLRYTRAVAARPGETPEARQQRIYEFENDRTFADYIGDLSEDAKKFFIPVVMRSAADPHEIAAGAGIGYFSLIWNIGQGLGRSIVGGAATLTEHIAQTIRDRIQLGAVVEEVIQHPDHVVVRYTRDGQTRETKARTAVMATPASITHKVAVNLSSELHEALGKIKYGPHVAGAFLTNETKPMPYDGTYGIATANKSFTVALNQGNLTRGRESTRQSGGSMMTFSPASMGRKLWDVDKETIAQTYIRDLNDIFPGFEDIVEDARIEKFEFGSPYAFPGRARLQPILTRPEGRVFLAGDYLGTLYTETAISSGITAASEAASVLATDRQTSPAPSSGRDVGHSVLI
ncbi:FAD-dependent oxidoreductase [Glutamicibacter sp. MNS18]|uniref:flavin monoamine oxidase family protein n=1 Tax=Glutamicibacter sp. MNS18 TaxID=2989817 RepID=UPI002235F22D|nr:NAD(P)/FAD-dependent oxidoreductase [Glutamicibacter sp. MNS18]MCW4466786.1 FAD-dependent oxidoreductase [Glutamicibacter sp. MNS18]